MSRTVSLISGLCFEISCCSILHLCISYQLISPFCLFLQGRFEILCLSGSYLFSNDGGSRNRTGGLSVSLASPDGCVIGGGVGGVLIAASPVQVTYWSFWLSSICGLHSKLQSFYCSLNFSMVRLLNVFNAIFIEMQKFYQLAFSNCTELDYLLCQ